MDFGGSLILLLLLLGRGAGAAGYSVRLISLGIVGERSPQLKAFYALQLRPINGMLQLLHRAGVAPQQQQKQQQPTDTEEAAQEARAALFFLPPEANSTNPFLSASRDGLLVLPPAPDPNEGSSSGPIGRSPHSGSSTQRRPKGPKRQRETGVVLVENLPYEVTDGGALQEAMKHFGETKFVFFPKDKADPTRGTGKA